jgi:hypothetical protein
MVPSPIAEMLERNRYVISHHLDIQTNNTKPIQLKPTNCPLPSSSKYASTHQSPPRFLKMVEMAKASGSGVLVLSCSDPRVNPHEILGLDVKLSSELIEFINLSTKWSCSFPPPLDDLADSK